MVSDDLDIEPATTLERMPLLFGNELPPYIQVFPRPSIRTICEYIVWENVIIAEGRYDRNDEIVCRIGIVVILGFPKDLSKLVYHELVLFHYLSFAAGYLLVIVVSGRVTGPDNKVYIVSYVILDPLEGSIEERYGRVAI